MRRLVLLLLIAGAACSRKKPSEPAESAPRPVASVTLDDKQPSDAPRRVRKPPTGAPPRLSCRDARALVGDVTARLAVAPGPIPKSAESAFQKNLADGTLDWADPHGLWTASPDSPVATLMRARAAKLHAVLEGRADCAAELRPMGEALAKWVGELRNDWDVSAKDAHAAPNKAATEAAFEDGPLTKPARTLAKELASRTAGIQKLAPDVASEVAIGRERWLPVLGADAWSEVLLAAAVRAYVPLIDPHGAWAPIEESATLYDRDLEVAPPPRLWTASTRTAIGVRVDGGAVAPLVEKDVILSIDNVTVAGLSAEAIDQLGETPDGAGAEPRIVRVLRTNGAKLSVVRLEVRAGLSDEPAAPDPLPVEEIAYGESRALVVRLTDVPDGLGEDLARTIALAKGTPAFAGIILDLRGNGGGSIDGATSALGLFLPGAPLFPLKHRDGAIETERAAEPPVEDRWSGPIAAIVDGGTASAAEMIAGALHAYRRGVVIGTTTYGKGCAQEYVDDVTGVGVVRLTTLLFALPDGSPVQKLGIHPDFAIALPKPASVKDREADLPRAAPTWTGPDVRDPKRIGEVPWPLAKTVGPCKDEALCRALRALSTKHADVAKR
jgi:carboxyl-terminal processing protease